jgi:hypothetical protein
LELLNIIPSPYFTNQEADPERENEFSVSFWFRRKWLKADIVLMLN